MTFEAWAARPFTDGEHRITSWPLDPLHPLRHGQFTVTLNVLDGRITSCQFDVHANHRGDEKLLEVRDVRQGLALIDRHGWLTAPFAEVLYARIVESLLGMRISERAAELRSLLLAINRAAVDALWQHLDASLIGVHSDALARRNAWLDTIEAWTGARMHVTYTRIGGVAHDIDDDLLASLIDADDAHVATAARAVANADGAVAMALPKVLRIPHAEAYDEIQTPHGILGMWIVGRGDKVPHRLHLRTSGFRMLAELERHAVGMSTSELLLRLARTRLVLGEVSR